MHKKTALTSQQILFLFNNWLNNEAKNYIPARVKELSQKTGLSPNKIILKNTKSQWGSCSRSKNISLSYNLISASKAAIDYVIIHELCHLEHMNHSKDFWNLVTKHYPNYKTQVKWLKTHSFLLALQDKVEFI